MGDDDFTEIQHHIGLIGQLTNKPIMEMSGIFLLFSDIS